MIINKRQKTYYAEFHIKDLVLDKDVQMRAALSRPAIADYAEVYRHGGKMPCPVVFWMPGGKKYVADGMHRVLAKKMLTKQGVKGHTTIRCEVRTGNKRDAMLYAAGANRTHGVRRTNEDKRKCVLSFLGDEEWRQWADTEIARHAGVTPSMVGRYRKYLGSGAKSDLQDDGGEMRVHFDAAGKKRLRYVPESNILDPKLPDKLRGDVCPMCGQPTTKGRVR